MNKDGDDYGKKQDKKSYYWFTCRTNACIISSYIIS